MQLIGEGGGENQQIYWEFWIYLGRNSKKNLQNAGMTERLVIDLAIEEAVQDEIKDTLEHNNN